MPNSQNQAMVGVHHMQVGPSLIDPLVSFLKDGTLPKDRGDFEKIWRKASWYWLFEELKLYRHSFLGPYLLYVHSEALESLLEELNEGIYGNHTRGILITQSPYSGILVEEHAQNSPRLCQEIWPMSKICLEHSPTWSHLKPPFLVRGHLRSGDWI